MKNSKTFIVKGHNNKRAFTLIELSIVLIIISLLVAGVTGGASLIKSAELRNVMGEARGYKVAVNNFYTQFDELPGDYENQLSGAETGDENDQIEFINGGGSSTTTATNDVAEGIAAWQQLVVANIIDDPEDINGTITDADVSIAATTPSYTCGDEMPSSKLDDGCWAFDWDDSESRNVVVVTAGATVSAAHAVGTAQEIDTTGVLSPADALSVDSKVDDGDPEAGTVLGIGTDCIDTGEYDTTEADEECALSFEVDVLQ